MKHIIELIYDLLRKGLKGLSLVFLAMIFAACESSPSSSGEATTPDLSPTLTDISLTVKSGIGVGCFSFDNYIICRGFSSPTYVVEVISARTIRSFEVLDHTLCYEVNVTQRPWSRTPGLATYCIGPASLNASYAPEHIVFGGPNFTTATNGSNDLGYATEPFMGADLTVDYLVNHSTIMADSMTSVVTTTPTCQTNADRSSLVCPSFHFEGL